MSPDAVLVEIEAFVDYPDYGEPFGVAAGYRLPSRQPVYVAIRADRFQFVLNSFYLQRRKLLRRRRRPVYVIVSEDRVTARENYRSVPPWWAV